MSGWFWIRIGAILGLLGVATGAFGAHGLRERLAETGQAANYQTAASYQMTHALALLAVGCAGLARGLAGRDPSGSLNVAGWSFLVGVLVFSGSLYVLALTGQRWLGAITPIGGVAMLIGWAALIVATFTQGEARLADSAPSAEPAVVETRR
ncbi:MAG: DUF423 domain-containing protein [Isosphaeraceae bacterium]